MAGWQADEIQVNFLKLYYRFKLFIVFNKVTALLQQYECVQAVSLVKVCCKAVVRSEKIWKP